MRTRLEEGSAQTGFRRKKVHTHALRGGRCTQRALKMKVNASATTKMREVLAHAFRARSCTHTHPEGTNKSAMRRDWSSICPTSAVPKVRRCSTCPEGGDATYVQRKKVQLVSK
jgi:hypothetical protein